MPNPHLKINHLIHTGKAKQARPPMDRLASAMSVRRRNVSAANDDAARFVSGYLHHAAALYRSVKGE